MLRIASAAVREIAARTTIREVSRSIFKQHIPENFLPQCRRFGLLSVRNFNWSNEGIVSVRTLPGFASSGSISQALKNVCNVPVRTVTKFSLKKGKRKTTKKILRCFYRLEWGVWIRRQAGCKTRVWKKKAKRLRRLQYYVFTNSQQTKLLDKLVTNYWRRPRFYVDDPYNPYHKREEFLITRKDPLPLP